jgi:hypothetical protein
MPELVPKSTAAPAAPPIPPGYPPIPPELLPVAVPPVIQPAAWGDFCLFRESALIYVSEPEFNSALRTVADYFFGMLLECQGDWPEWPESSTRTELRAAVADLRHLVAFLAGIGKHRRFSTLSEGDKNLSRYASEMARVLNRLANGIERKLVKEGAAS